MKGVCRLCGCTDSTPCLVNGEPCAWVLDDLCSACVVEVGDYLVPKECRHCRKIEEGWDPWHAKKCHTCSEGRFDGPNLSEGAHQWFYRSGIQRPNKTVAKAQFKCPLFAVSDQWKKEAQ
jgi:hypothetical protein